MERFNCNRKSIYNSGHRLKTTNISGIWKLTETVDHHEMQMSFLQANINTERVSIILLRKSKLHKMRDDICQDIFV